MAFALSKQAALRALSINPDLAEAHVSLANVLFYSQGSGRRGSRI